MLSLREKALLSALSDAKTLKEVLQFCSENGSARDLCMKSKAFWLNILPQVGHEQVSVSFEPLKEKYWPELMQALSNDLYRKYFYSFDDYIDQLDGFQDQVFYEASDAQGKFNIFDPDNVEFYIPGIKLKSETPGWILEMSIDSKIKQSVFILASEADDLSRIAWSAALMLKHLIGIEILGHINVFNPNHIFYALITDENNERVKSVKLEPKRKYYDLKEAEKIELPYSKILDVQILKGLIYIAMMENEHNSEITRLSRFYLYFNSREYNVSEGPNPKMQLFYSTRMILDFNAAKVSLY